MPVHILVTGPVRPSIVYLCTLCQQLRSIVRDCKIHVGYWKTTKSDHEQIAEVSDTAVAFDEPIDSWIDSNIRGRTIQQRQLGTIEDTTSRMFKMFHGVQLLLDHLQLPDDATVMRVRTDLYIRTINASAINSILTRLHPSTLYLCPRRTGGNSCDWFGISTTSVLRRLYGYASVDEYNETIGSVWNPEGVLIANALKFRLLFCDINGILSLAIYRGPSTDKPEIHIFP